MTAATLQLARRHQEAQARLAEALRSAVATQWRTHITAPRTGGDAFLASVIPLIRAQYAASGRLAKAYYTQVRRWEAPGAPRFTLELPPLPEGAVRAAVAGAGFKVMSEALERGEDLAQAIEVSETGVAGAAVRLGLKGGREYIRDAAVADKTATGFYWQTRQDGEAPCYWCAMLASRGPVFHRHSWPESDPRPDGLLKVEAHDDCKCHMVPVFSESPDVPDSMVQLQRDWLTITEGFSGKEKVREWRRKYDTALLSTQASTPDAA